MKTEQITEVFAGVPVVRKARADGGRHLILHEKQGVVWAASSLLERQDWLVHAFSTRLGGVSRGDIGSMNLSFSREDDPEHVRENYRRFSQAVGFDPEKLVCTRQTHTVNIREVTEADAGKGYSRETDYTDVDGLVTDVPSLVLSCFGSDCVMLLAADPVRRVVGCAHSGWRGTVGNIGGRLIDIMRERYGCDPGNILTVIGPSICQECYEVSDDVAGAFADAYPATVHGRLFYRKENGKYQLDLWQGCAIRFEQAGVRPENICLSDLCTRCNPQLLYSHRRQKGRQTNLTAVISIAS